MAGTVAGGRLAAITNRKRYGKGFYQEIGRLGGLKSRNGGFAANPELAREAGRKGGLARGAKKSHSKWTSKYDSK